MSKHKPTRVELHDLRDVVLLVPGFKVDIRQEDTTTDGRMVVVDVFSVGADGKPTGTGQRHRFGYEGAVHRASRLSSAKSRLHINI